MVGQRSFAIPVVCVLVLLASRDWTGTIRANDLDIKELARKSLAAREAIHTYELRTSAQAHFIAKEARHRTSSVSIWRAQDKHRVDHTVEAASAEYDQSLLGKRQIGCRNCERPGHTLYTFNSVSDVTFARKGERSAGETMLEDYRMLGYLNTTSLDVNENKLGDYLFSARLKDYKVEYSDLDGVRCLLVRSVVVRSGVPVRVWIRPDQGYNVVRIESSGTNPNGSTWKYETRSLLVQDTGSGIWFPKRWTHVREDGGVKEGDYSIDVQFARFNHVIPDTVFTLAGIAPADGTAIRWPELKTSSQAPIWRNGRPDPKETVNTVMQEFLKQAPSPPTPVDPPADYRWWYAAAAVLLGGLGVWLVVARIRRGRAG